MVADIWTMVWKEWREYLLQRAGARSGTYGIAIMLGVYGIFLPLQAGRAWIETWGLRFFSIVPVMLVITVIADSFAGERERHTLETLLATRLSDRTILFGKLLAATLYGWAFTLVALLLGLITVNLTNGSGGLLLFTPDTALTIVVLSFLEAALAANAGVLVSLRASSMRQAQQTLGVAMMVLIFGVIFSVRAMPKDMSARLLSTLAAGNLTEFALAGTAILVAINLALLAVSLALFQRPRLILD